MKFKTCSCSKDITRCVKTGFSFNHEGFERNSDLFLCASCKALAIHGVPSGKLPSRPSNSTFTGLLVSQDEEYGESAEGGIIDLSENDLNYIRRHHNIDAYAIEEDQK